MIKKLFFLGSFLIFSSIAVVYAENVRETSVVKVVRENASCVVNVSTERVLFLRQNPFWGSYGSEFDEFFNHFYGVQRPSQALKFKSVGSGVIVSEDGLIVTNVHVVNMASDIIVILNDGTSVKGRVVFESVDKDVALIKIDSPQKLTPAKLARPGDIFIGETVVAVGNPLGLENSVTVGVVSGINRQFFFLHGRHVFEDLIQTDAPINPGNSGGALFNLDGDLIGINMAVVQNSQSIGFAIPAQKVKSAIEAYKEHLKRRAQSDIEKRTIWNMPVSRQQWLQEELRRESLENFALVPDLKIEPQADSYIIQMDMTDLKKDTINTRVDGRHLTVFCERSKFAEEKQPGSSYKMESFGSSSRSILLPEDADASKMTTEIKDNTFIIRIPKKG